MCVCVIFEARWWSQLQLDAFAIGVPLLVAVWHDCGCVSFGGGGAGGDAGAGGGCCHLKAGPLSLEFRVRSLALQLTSEHSYLLM